MPAPIPNGADSSDDGGFAVDRIRRAALIAVVAPVVRYGADRLLDVELSWWLAAIIATALVLVPEALVIWLP